MTSRFAQVVALIMLITLPASAQDAEIFAPAVAIMGTATVQSQTAYVETSTVYIFNEVTKAYDAYPFPAEVERVDRAWDYGRADGRWMVVNAAGDQWLLDRATGEYEVYAPACEPDVVQIWVYYDEAGQTYLCNTETGARSRSLPQTHDEVTLRWPSQEWSFRRKGIEPNGQWVIFIGEDAANPTYGGAYIYSYHISSDTIRYIGRLGDMLIEIDGWFGDRVVLKSRYDTPSIYLSVYHRLRLDETDSLTAMGSVWFNETLQLYQWQEKVGDRQCLLMRYDPWKDAQTEHPFAADDCSTWLASLPNSDAYVYLDATRNANQRPITRTLVQWNPLTGERVEVFTDEIERYLDTDGRYVVLVTDHNGQIDEIMADFDIYNPYSPYINLTAEPEMIVVDLMTHERVYALDVNWQDGDYWYRWLDSYTGGIDRNWISGGGADISVIPIGQDRLIVTNNLCRMHEELCQDTLVTITDGTIEEVKLTGQADFVLQECDVLLVRGQNRVYDVYDIRSGEMEPLLVMTPERMEIQRVIDGRYVRVRVDDTIYTVAPHPRCVD